MILKRITVNFLLTKIYISIDIDVFSRKYVLETGYPSRCGIDVKCFLKAFKYLVRNNRIVGIDLMEFSPNEKYSNESKFVSYLLLEMLSVINSDTGG